MFRLSVGGRDALCYPSGVFGGLFAAARRTPHAALWALFALTACPDDETGKDTAGAPEVPPEWVMEALDPTDCSGALPEARRYAHLASFTLDAPVSAGGREVTRGLLLHGGLGASGALDDTWNYDLGAVEGMGCRWVSLGSTGAPRYGGVAGFDPDVQQVTIAGGVVESSGTQMATSAVVRVGLDGTLHALTTLPTQSAVVMQRGDAECEDGDIDHQTQDEDCVDGQIVSVAACDPAVVVDELTHHFACVDDPYCLYGSREHYLEADVSQLWAAAGWSDPSTGDLGLVGGSTGCDGAGCGSHDAVALHEVDPSLPYSLVAANFPGRIEVTGGSAAVSNSDVWDTSPVAAETDGTELTSMGVRGMCAAAVGWSWNRATHDYDTTGLDERFFGGTWAQDLPQATRFDVYATCEAYWEEGCEDHCLDWSGEWTPDAPWFGTASDGLVDAGLYDDGWPSMSPVAPAHGSRVYDCAMAPVGHAPGGISEVVVVGGRTADSGGGNTEVWTSTGTVVTPSAGYTARYGASAVFDVVGQDVYVFGGSLSDAPGELFRIRTPYSLEPGDGVTWSTTALDARFEEVGARTWQRTTTIDAHLACASTACLADSVEVVVPLDGASAAETGSLLVTVTVDGYPASFGLFDLPFRDVPRGVHGADLALSVPLQPNLTASADVEVAVEWTDSVTLKAGFDAATDVRDATTWPLGVGSRGVEHVSVKGFAGWLAGEDAAWSWGVAVPATLTVVATPPVSFLAQGTRTDVSASESRFTFTAAPIQAWLLVIDGGVKLGELSWPSGGTLRVYTDGHAGTDVSLVAQAYLTGELAGDLAWLEQLGTPPADWNLVFLVGHVGDSELAGRTRAGNSAITRGAPDGTLTDLRHPRQTTVHELTHLWFGERRTFSELTAWLREGIPQLALLTRAGHEVGAVSPEHPARWGFRTAVTWGGKRRKISLRSAKVDDRYDDIETSLLYGASAHALSELHALWLARGGTEADFWAVWAGLVAGTGEVSEDEIKVIIDTLDGPGTWFYDEWVADGRRGAPIVAVTTYVPAPAVPDTSSPTGERPAGPTSLVVEQVQDTLFGWSTWSYAAYALLCPDVGGGLIFAECAGTVTMPGGSPRVLAGGSGAVPLTEDTGVTGGSGGLPGTLTLLANHELPPAHWSDVAGVGQEVGLCATGSTLAGCATDVDADGWPALADCLEGDPARHPGCGRGGPAQRDGPELRRMDLSDGRRWNMHARNLLRLGLVGALLVGAVAGVGAALWPRPAVSTEDDALEAYRGMLRNFQSLRLFVRCHRMVQDGQGWARDPAMCRSQRSWACEGDDGEVVLTLLADGRTTVDHWENERVRRLALLPSGAVTYDPWRAADSPTSPLPLGELEAPVRALDTLLRSGFGQGMAEKGSAAELGITYRGYETESSYIWYRLPVDVPMLGSQIITLTFDAGGDLHLVTIPDGERLHELRMSPHLVNFEVEPRWFDTDLERLVLPWYAGEDLPAFPRQTGRSSQVE